jgi:hypothetical protein
MATIPFHHPQNPVPPLPDRRIEIGLNIISLHNVRDTEHTFSANILLQVRWDARPRKIEEGKEIVPFRPWIQLHNIREIIEEVQNEGMPRFSDKKLLTLVKDYYKPGSNKDIKKDPCYVLEIRNFIGEFVNELDLQAFPFDEQKLKITIIANETHVATLTHRHPRQEQDNWWPKWDDARGKGYSPSIKCNLEAETMSEWNVLLQSPLEEDVKNVMGNAQSAKAVCLYKFQEHDPLLSAAGAIYQRLDVRVIAQREVSSIMHQIVLPTFLLSFSSLSVFAVDPVDGVGDRLNILYTVALTIVANQFVTQERLPILNYRTFIDYFLLGTQLFVYLLIIEASCVVKIAQYFSMDTYVLDQFCMIGLLLLYVVFILLALLRALILYQKRKWQAKRLDMLGRWCFYDEELRMARLYGKIGEDQFPTQEQLRPPKSKKPKDDFISTAQIEAESTRDITRQRNESRTTQYDPRHRQSRSGNNNNNTQLQVNVVGSTGT